MKRRLAMFLGLSLAASPAWAQDKNNSLPTLPPPQRELKSGETTPPDEAPPPKMVAEAPATEAFVAPSAAYPTVTLSVDFLQWWYKGNPIPPLLTTSQETDTKFAGTFNDPTATVLIGRNSLDFKSVPGIRAYFTVALADQWDFELGGFLMEQKTTTAIASGVDGQPFLTRPFYNQHDQFEAGFDVSTSNAGVNGLSKLSGVMSGVAKNQFYGYEANFAWHSDIPNSALNKLLVGFRQLSLHESLLITENVSEKVNSTDPNDGALAFFPPSLADPNFNPATQSLRIIDGFRSRNEFYGPQVGGLWRWRGGPLTFDFLAKVAVGVNHETISAAGSTSRLTNGVVTDTGPGGLLAVSTNSGQRTFNELTVVPEIGLKLNFDLTERIKLNAGYSVIYLSSVVRTGNQIDHRMNPEFVPSDRNYNPGTNGPFVPRAFFRDTDFYAHGVNFGMTVSY